MCSPKTNGAEGGALGEEGALAASPRWHRRTSSALLVPLLSPSSSPASSPSRSSPAALLPSQGYSQNTLEVVDLTEAPVCGTRNALGDGTPRPGQLGGGCATARTGDALSQQKARAPAPTLPGPPVVPGPQSPASHHSRSTLWGCGP